MKWSVSWPRTTAEDDKMTKEVEADSIEDAILAAERLYSGSLPHAGQVYTVVARVRVSNRMKLPLKSA